MHINYYLLGDENNTEISSEWKDRRVWKELETETIMATYKELSKVDVPHSALSPYHMEDWKLLRTRNTQIYQILFKSAEKQVTGRI